MFTNRKSICELVDITWSMGVIPVPPHIIPIHFFMLGTYFNLGKGPLISIMSPSYNSKNENSYFISEMEI